MTYSPSSEKVSSVKMSTTFDLSELCGEIQQVEKQEGSYSSAASKVSSSTSSSSTGASAPMPSIKGNVKKVKEVKEEEKKEFGLNHPPLYYGMHHFYKHIFDVIKTKCKEYVDGIMPSFNGLYPAANGNTYKMDFSKFPAKLDAKVEECRKEGKTINFEETLKGYFQEMCQVDGKDVIPEIDISVNDLFEGFYFNDYFFFNIQSKVKNTPHPFPIHCLWAGFQEKDNPNYFNRKFSKADCEKMWGNSYLPFRLIQTIAKDMGIFISAGKTDKGEEGESIIKVTFAPTDKLVPLVGGFQTIPGLKKSKKSKEETEEEEVEEIEELTSMTYKEFIAKVYDFYYYSNTSVFDEFEKDCKKEGVTVSYVFKKKGDKGEKNEDEVEEPKTTGGAKFTPKPKFQKTTGGAPTKPTGAKTWADKAKNGKKSSGK